MMRRGLLAAIALAGIVGAACGEPDGADVSAADARSEIRALVEDVTEATASRFGLTDDQGHVMDGAKIVWVPEADAFAAVSHAWSDRDQAFHIHLATSTDLMSWTWVVELANEASQPTIAAATDGGYVVAWEQEPDPIHIVAARFATWEDLRAGTIAKRFDVPITTRACGEGTPAIGAASAQRLELSFHYHLDCVTDRQAAGSTDWDTWTASPRHEIDEALQHQGATGGIGDRDVISFRGHNLMLIEGQLMQDEFGSFRVFLYDDESQQAERLEFRTPGGSVAFTNPTVAPVRIGGADAILVTLFLPGEGAADAEAGELIYYRVIEEP